MLQQQSVLHSIALSDDVVGLATHVHQSHNLTYTVYHHVLWLYSTLCRVSVERHTT
jgi:hypothetical protein